MQDFLLFFDDMVSRYPMHLEIYYSKMLDWCIHIYKKGCGDDGKDLEILHVQNCDMQFVFAEAQVKLKDWLCEHEGGY